MASTRNKNTQPNYTLEQKENNELCTRLLYAHGSNGSACDQKISGFGLNPGRLTFGAQSYNPVDTESFLFGINSTNLTQQIDTQHICFTPEFKYLSQVNFIEQQPTIMPRPFITDFNQRPAK